MTTLAGRTTTNDVDTITPRDTATIIETLGKRLIRIYGGSGSPADPASDEEASGPDEEASGPDEDDRRSAWRTKQREKLLLALIKQVSLNALRTGNAALSATDAAIERFSRTQFKEGSTRSHRDRAPITKNIDKLIGGWLRRLGRTTKQNGVVVSVSDWVKLGTHRGKYRLTIALVYPWRLIRDRRLEISVRIDSLHADHTERRHTYRSDPKDPAVVLPQSRSTRREPRRTRQIEYLLRLLQQSAEDANDEELREYAERGLVLFVPTSGPKMLAMLFAASVAIATVSGAVEWVAQWVTAGRLQPAVTVTCNPKPAVIMRFLRSPSGGLVVEKSGLAIPFRNGVAVDTSPALGDRNIYAVRAARSVLARYTAHISVDMPACTPKSESCATCDDVAIVPTSPTGTLDMTIDKSGLGDPPTPLLPTTEVPFDAGHMDEHLDAYVAGDCVDVACSRLTFRAYFGPINANDVQLTINYGDGTAPTVLGTANVGSPKRRYLFGDPAPSFMKAPLQGSTVENYSLFATHHYKADGSYDVHMIIAARSRPGEPYRFVKRLQRRVRVGTIATIEMVESYRLPEHHGVPVPDAHSQ